VAIFVILFFSARRVSENAFGILANRFRLYLQPFCASLDTTRTVITATVILHNYLRNCEIARNDGVQFLPGKRKVLQGDKTIVQCK